MSTALEGADNAAASEDRGWRRLIASCVSPGVWATAMPFPSVLGYSYCYSVRVLGGIVVVDLGWDSDEAWQVFQAGLQRAGAALDEIVGVVATHVHPDHYGLAGRIKADTDAWIAVHAAETQYVVGGGDRADKAEQLTDWLRACGVPRNDGLAGEVTRLVTSMASVPPDVVLADGDSVPDTDGALIAVHTPGHTAGHLCFHDRSRGLLFTGDHVLPRVTPNVSKRPGSSADPLGDFVDSLNLLRDIDESTLVLPGHEWPFDRLSDRLGVLSEHHAHRLGEIAQAVEQGAATVWEVANALRWSRPFDRFDARAQRQALGETYAHLHRLEHDGRLGTRVRNSGTIEWHAPLGN
ncbi:MBL fold metallo-hydrolase [Nocardia sp. NPDC058518]|uniref:MBL fold metallo-hydrolase n=1 Tax=Nocardia sp. NPDC058518 TaxID=3346534 RepID=UPI00365A5D73